MIKMSKAQELIVRSSFLADTTENRFRTNLSGDSRYGGITCWAVVIQYLLRIC